MSKANPFADIMNDTPAEKPMAPPPAAKKPTPEPEVKRGRGRPAGPQKDTQPTTLRLHPDDHLEVKQLALRDKQQMNDLIYEALRLYCKTRGVTLKHAPISK
jgi:hypothetical protein